MAISLSMFEGVRAIGATQDSPLGGSAVSTGIYELPITEVFVQKTSQGSPFKMKVHINGIDIQSEFINNPADSKPKFAQVEAGRFMAILQACTRDGAEKSVFDELQPGGALESYADRIDELFLALGSDEVPAKVRCIIRAGYAWTDNEGNLRKKAKLVHFLNAKEFAEKSAREASGELVIEDSNEYETQKAQREGRDAAAVQGAGRPSFGGGNSAPTSGGTGRKFTPPPPSK